MAAASAEDLQQQVGPPPALSLRGEVYKTSKVHAAHPLLRGAPCPQVEALQANCPVLCPAVTPSGYDVQDLFALMQDAGKPEKNAGPCGVTDCSRS
jgi:hypothetical protein